MTQKELDLEVAERLENLASKLDMTQLSETDIFNFTAALNYAITTLRWNNKEADPEKAMEYSLHKLAERLAEHILPLAEWVQEYSPKDQSYYLNMRIGIAENKREPTRYFDDMWRIE